LFLLYDLNMNEIKYPEGFVPLDIFISSIGKERITDRIEGSNRNINYGSVYSDRDLELSVLLKAHDTQDYRLLRDEVYALFNEHDLFYVVEKYQRGKRYLVSVDEKYIPDRMTRRHATATINCSMPELPFAESIGTTADITGNVLKYSDELWSYGMGLLYDEESHKYIHAGTKFRIYNAGNVAVHPFEQYLKINIPTIFSSENYFELINKTTGDVFRVNEGMNTRSIEIDGPNVKIDGFQALRKTNRQFISLAPGWNEFEVKGAGSARVEFDFRYYYK